MNDLILKAMEMAKAEGFEEVAHLDVATLNVMDEVRAMCSNNSCGMYGKNWACPPACGDLASCREAVSRYADGILVQTVGEVEDSMDFEGMMETEARHRATFIALASKLREESPNLLALGAGCCTLCAKCTCPDEPCRFPEKRISSMEAYGILVSDICKKNNMKYYYGSDHIAYTSCYLLVEKES